MNRVTCARAAVVLASSLAILVTALVPALPQFHASAASMTALITGEIERLTLNNPNDIWSGGTMVVGGQNVIIPRNLLMDLPANRLSLQQAFTGAPPACLARSESGLAKSDACNTSGTGAIARVPGSACRADAGRRGCPSPISSRWRADATAPESRAESASRRRSRSRSFESGHGCPSSH